MVCPQSGTAVPKVSSGLGQIADGVTTRGCDSKGGRQQEGVIAATRAVVATGVLKT